MDQTNFGIVCLTQNNLEAPWLLFEAGALAKGVEKGRVCCLLLGGLRPVQVTGPLQQFQNRQFEKVDFWHLLSDLNRHIDKSLDPAELETIFRMWWPHLEKEVETALTDEGAPVEHGRDQSEMLEEILLRARSIEQAVWQFHESTRLEHAQRTIRELAPRMLSLLSEFMDENKEPVGVWLSHLKKLHQSTSVDELLLSPLVQMAVRRPGEDIMVAMSLEALNAFRHYIDSDDSLST